MNITVVSLILVVRAFEMQCSPAANVLDGYLYQRNYLLIQRPLCSV